MTFQRNVVSSVVACLTMMSVPGWADVSTGSKAYMDKNYDVAFSEFTKSSKQGDVLATRYLALMYLLGQGTKKDELRALQLSRQCAEAGDMPCMLQVAESNLLGRGTPLNFPEARQWARKAWEKGDLRGGHYLAQAYLLDPNNRHIVNGKVDRSKYEALAHRELAQRADQIEALDALAASAQSGFVPSRILLAFVLYEQSGGAPAEKIVTLLASIKDLPANAQKVLSSSRQVIALGATRASPRLLADSLTIAAMGATAQAKSGGVKDVKECKDFRLMKISNVTPIQDVEWLPLKQELVAHTYPLKGFWTEDWNVNLCNTSYTVKMRFDVDGLGGAYYTAVGGN